MNQVKKILHADDVERFRVLVEDELKPDYQVASVKDCDEVLATAAQDHPDLVILDHLMPSDSDDTGFEVCQKLRELYSDLPIVIYTGAWEDAMEPAEVEKIWGARVVFKSHGEEALKKVVDELLATN